MLLNVLTDASGETKVMLNKEMCVTKYYTGSSLQKIPDEWFKP